MKSSIIVLVMISTFGPGQALPISEPESGEEVIGSVEGAASLESEIERIMESKIVLDDALNNYIEHLQEQMDRGHEEYSEDEEDIRLIIIEEDDHGTDELVIGINEREDSLSSEEGEIDYANNNNGDQDTPVELVLSEGPDLADVGAVASS